MADAKKKASERQKRAAAAKRAARTRARNKTATKTTKRSTAKRSTSTKSRASSKSKSGTSAAQKRAGKRLAAFMAAKRAGKSVEAAKRSAIRKVPLKASDSFKGSTARKSSSKRKTPTKRSRTVGAAKGKTYTRVYVTDPKTGKRKLSWLYKDAKGKKRKIPHKKIIDSGYRKRDQVVKARERAAKKILESGGTFVPNAARKKSMAKKTSAKQKRAGRRLAAFMAAKRSGKGVEAAKRAALRKVPLAAGDTFKGSTKGGAKRKPAKRKASTKARRATTTRRKATRKKSPVRRRKTTYKPVAGVRVCKPVRRKTAKKKPMTKARRSAIAKKAARTRKRNMAKGSTRKAAYRKNGRGTYRRRRRTMRKNQFMSRLKNVLKTGLFVAGGFLSHKVLTGFAMQGVDSLAPTLFANPTAFTWKKPAIGFGVLLVGIPLSRMALKKNSTEVAAGMAASWIQSVIVSSLNALNQPTWAGHLSGYSNSRAYALRGNGMERNAASIMPEYSRLSGFQQAAAGMGAFQQAAAGMGAFQQAAAGTGEYFQANATGEYFAPNNLQGVGSYEGAGQLALQAAAGAQDIDDGIRPDSDIDGIMDLAEAAAGLRGTGEFYSAVRAGGGRVIEKRVGQQSQWIPNGPLWAGTDSVDDTQATSELSAGILQRGGGNGILSA
jgi:hypothetical protein